jgi:ElaB/YqjD/DUF883 family membrane-anchored ribosome-binding protein
MSTSNPDEIRRDIDATRGRLSDDVNALTETVRPGNVARRQGEHLKSGATRLRERVMGKAEDVGSTGGDMLSSASETAQSVPTMAKSRTQGNPLAAGLIALGAGWLVGSLLPASRVEQQAAEKAKDAAQPLMEEAKSVGQEAAQNLKEPAQEAAENIKSQAKDAADTVKEEGRSAGEDVTGSVKQAKDEGSSGSSGPSTGGSSTGPAG